MRYTLINIILEGDIDEFKGGEIVERVYLGG
jgi:hypothetical protein